MLIQLTWFPETGQQELNVDVHEGDAHVAHGYWSPNDDRVMFDRSDGPGDWHDEAWREDLGLEEQELYEMLDKVVAVMIAHEFNSALFL